MDDALPPIAGNHQNAPISRLIAEVVERCPGERITLGEMAEAFGDRASVSYTHLRAHET